MRNGRPWWLVPDHDGYALAGHGLDDVDDVPEVNRPQDADRLLSPGDVAYRLGLSRTQAWRLMRAGVLGPVVDVAYGTRTTPRVRRGDLDAWVESRTTRDFTRPADRTPPDTTGHTGADTT